MSLVFRAGVKSPNLSVCSVVTAIPQERQHSGFVMAKKSGKKTLIRWFPEPEAHDYPAAASYLKLIFDAVTVNKRVKLLERAPMTVFKAKDIFRASGLSLLGVSNSHVMKDRKKLEAGKSLSPLLLVRHSMLGRVIIADGYHRLCAVYMFDEDAIIPCKIV